MKLGKGILNLLLIFIEFILVGLILFAFAIRTGSFQTYLGKGITGYLSKKINKNIAINEVEIIFFDRVDLKGIYIEDNYSDTLLYTEQLEINIESFNLDSLDFVIDEIRLINGKINLIKDKKDSTFNFQYLVDFFDSDQVNSNDVDSSESNFNIIVDAISFENIQFKFHDNTIEKIDYGVNFSHLDISHLNIQLLKSIISPLEMSTQITQFEFSDQSGLQLKKLISDINYSSEGLSLKSVEIEMNNSLIKSDYFELLTSNGAIDFQDFLNDVDFNSKLSKSKINLGDIALFVPQLKGLTDDVKIKNIELKGPINNLFIIDSDIRMLAHTQLKGDFHLPDFAEIDSVYIDQNIDLFKTDITDIKRINLSPFIEDGIKIPDNLLTIGTVTLKNAHFKGQISNFVVDGDISTNLGSIHSENGLRFNKLANGIYEYSGAIDSAVSEDIIIRQLDLATLTENPNIGIVDGFFHIKSGSRGFSNKDINLMIDGKFNELELNGYTYKNIKIKTGVYHQDKFTGEIDVLEDNLSLIYKGYVDLKDDLEFDFSIDIDSAYLSKLKLTNSDPSTLLSSKIDVKLKGNSLKEISGDIKISGFKFEEVSKHLNIDQFTMSISRNEFRDEIDVKSDILDANLSGIFDFSNMYYSIKNQVAALVPNLIELDSAELNKLENYVLDVNLKNINPILNFIDDQLTINKRAGINLKSNSKLKTTTLEIFADNLKYGEQEINDIKFLHSFDSLHGDLNYEIKSIKLNDSLIVDEIKFNALVENNVFNTALGWDDNEYVKSSKLAFTTHINEDHDILTEFNESFFHLQNAKWHINSKSELLWNGHLIKIVDLNLKHKEHIINLDGIVSDDPNKWLNIRVKDFDLSELNGLIGGGIALEGNLNLTGKVSDVYNNLKFFSISNLNDLSINNELVGNVKLDGAWDKQHNAIVLKGNLVRNKKKTFDFSGNYFVNKITENLKLKLKFDHTDIAFLNAFSDPDLYTNIKGNIDGNLNVSGALNNPVIIGHLNVEKTKLSVPMFDVDYQLSGLLNFEKGEILADYLELEDELGNIGVGMMQIYHDNYANWNYDVTLDFDDPKITNTFLAMDTKYKDGDVYYGRAMITGDVNIFGYDGLTEINVNLKTQKGTDLTLPLYGSSETEENTFVKFYNPETNSTEIDQIKVERLGMTLNMNFEVNEQAKVNIVFDPVLNDQIEARGSGKIEMTMDDYGDIEMFGKYEIDEGIYNFNMKNIVTEQFEIISGSELIWTQSPYDANIDIKTRFKRNVSMNDIIVNSISNNGNKKDLIYGYLNLSNTLLNPILAFDIEAPFAKDEAKNALNQIRAIEDELNKQFFSLLLLKKFIAVEGAVASGSGRNVTEDLVNQQINSVLGQIGENYNLNSDIGTDHAELGFSTSFLDDKLKITSSVGVISSDDENKGSNIVGDVNIEYELNDDGTFTVNIFNQSNDNAASQDQGPFTQGFGLSYQETFNSRKDFKLWQGFLNLFRKIDKKQKSNKNNTNGRKVSVEEDFKPSTYEIEQ